MVTFQDGLIEMLERHARKGRLVYVEGKLQTRRWKKAGEETERSATEILLVPGSRVQFLDRRNGASKPAGDDAQQRRVRRPKWAARFPFKGVVLHRLFLPQGAGPACLARGAGPLCHAEGRSSAPELR